MRPSAPTSTSSAVAFGRDVCRHVQLCDGREWLVTNGLGSYASGSVSGALTRSYHGLLVAAIAPPSDRRLLLSHLDESIEQNGSVRLELSSNIWQGGGHDPDAARWLEAFALVEGLPCWLFSRDDLQVERRLWMEQGANITYVSYRVVRAEAPVTLRIRALVNQRSFHGGDRPADLRADEVAGGVLVRRYDGDPSALELLAWPQVQAATSDLVIQTGGVVYERYLLPRELERGLGSSDSHLQALELRLTLKPGDQLTLRARCLSPEPSDSNQHPADGEASWERRLQHQRGLLSQWRGGPGATVAPAPAWIGQLVLAADQFLVRRLAPTGTAVAGPTTTVIAGYHWFQDWGRDTLLSLPGLTISTGRLAIARDLLLAFAAAFDRGMLPNRFPELGRPLGEEDFNTVDAALRYFEALRQYVAASEDLALVEQLHEGLVAVLEHHINGTRYNIGLDPDDGLLACGASGVQLTWMDAIAGGRVITPRRGKPVEINALWLNALATMALLSGRIGQPAERWHTLTERVRSSFLRFWNPALGCCFDVIDGYAEQPGDPRRHVASIRPNQILAVSLPESGLSPEQQRGVVSVCARELLCSHGLRSLSPEDPAYAGHYGGGPSERDSRYHQGTVWGWLLGPFALAHWRCHRNRDQALGVLEPMANHLLDAGLGTISEIFDGDAPHAPDGCIAQAWSVAEVLRSWQQIASKPPDSA